MGNGVSLAGAQHSLSAIIRANNAAAAAAYIQMTAISPEQLDPALQNNSVALRRYGMAALQGEPEFFALLELQRKERSKEFALDVLVYQLRPQAHEAFRLGDYARAAELYGRIRARLTPVEQKKLAVAKARRQ